MKIIYVNQKKMILMVNIGSLKKLIKILHKLVEDDQEVYLAVDQQQQQ